MKTTSSIFGAFTAKALFFFAIIGLGLASSTECEAQSIVGRCKVVSVKLFLNAGGASEHQLRGEDKYEFVFKADHAYTVSQGPGNPDTGRWSVSGNQLTMIAPAEQRSGMKGRTSAFFITDNKMVRTVVAEPPYNEVQSKAVETSVRM